MTIEAYISIELVETIIGFPNLYLCIFLFPELQNNKIHSLKKYIIASYEKYIYS